MISNTHTHAHTHTPTGTLSGLNSTAATLWYVTTERMALPLEAVPVGALCLVANGGNLERAMELFQGKKVKDKKKRGIYLSAARSEIFNQIISKRIENNQFEALNIGDVFMLAGTQSVFLADAVDDKIKQRFEEKDIDLTASLWGAGDLMSQGESQTLEQKVADDYSEFCEGLAKFGLKQERRRIRLSLTEGKIKSEDDTVTLNFFLPSGCYATTILRELISYQDMTERAVN